MIAPASELAPDTIDAHPLVREHFGEQLRETHAAACTKLADIHRSAGELDRAREVFEEAERILRTEEPGWYVYGFSGFKFMDLLLSLGEVDQVRARAAWMLDWVRDHPRDPSATKLTTALAYASLR